MGKIFKICIYCLGCSIMALVAMLVGCGTQGQPEFLKGILTEIELGDTIVLDEYIDYVDEDYSIIVTGADNYRKDITNRATWQAEAPGEYSIVYTINSGNKKGTNSFILTVKPPKIVCTYTPQIKYVDLGEQLVFSDYYEIFNFQVDSYYAWEFVMDSVMFNGIEESVNGQTSYTFLEVGEYRMFFHVLSQDGQKAYFDAVIRCRSCDPEMAVWMEQNNVTAYNYSRLLDGQKVILGESVYQNKSANDPSGPNVSTYDMSYIAFEGEYGLNDYVVVDFTGNNMPIFSFFNDIVDASVWNKSRVKNRFNKATIVSNGWTNMYGNPVPNFVNSCNQAFEVYGPYKCDVYYESIVGVNCRDYIWDTKGRSGMADLTTEDRINSSYRIIIGITDGTAYGLTIELFLLDTNTGEVISNVKYTTPSSKDFGFGSVDYFKGSIALYGQFGKVTTFDKVYSIERNTTMQNMIKKYAKKSEFSAESSLILVNDTLNITDFITPKAGKDYTLSYKDSDGDITKVTENTFKFLREGQYTLIYADGENLPNTMDIFVVNQTMYDLGAFGYNAQFDVDNKLILEAGTHSGADDAIITKVTKDVDQSYLAFNGNYGLNDYVVVDFTGDNMPYFSFFTGEVKNSMFVDDSSTKELNKRLLLINGFRDKTGANISKYDGNRNAWIRAYGIYGIVHPESGVSVSEGMTNENIYLGYGIKAIQDSYASTHFRMIVGYTDATANSVKANIVLINLDTKAIVVEKSQTITFDGFSLEYFTGNIMLYGTFGKAITLDKVYAIEEDTTVDVLTEKYTPKQ